LQLRKGNAQMKKIYMDLWGLNKRMYMKVHKVIPVTKKFAQWFLFLPASSIFFTKPKFFIGVVKSDLSRRQKISHLNLGRLGREGEPNFPRFKAYIF
jgi:hypothetical protein